jgi:hypothetical protein
MDSNVETDQLIGSLGRQLQAVKPLRAPLWRALLWLAPVGLLAALAVSRHANQAALSLMTGELRVTLECAAALLTAVASIVSAFYLSVPDRSDLWRFAPLPPLALWLATSSLGCLRNGIGLGAAGARLGESAGCFKFILMVSVPLAALLFLVLRRARPLMPLRVALCGALGVAALAAFVLQFFHPFEVTLVDLAMHALAVTLIVAVAALVNRSALSAAA